MLPEAAPRTRNKWMPWGMEATMRSPDQNGVSCRKITNLGHEMTNYIEREQDNMQWARQFNIANQLINNWARARRKG